MSGARLRGGGLGSGALSALRVKGSFARNFATTLSGNAVTIALQLLLSPLIARLYGPSAYGLYSVFNSLVINLSLIFGLQYAQAFVLAKDEDEFSRLFQLTLRAAVVAFFLVEAIALVAAPQLLGVLGSEAMGAWGYAIPAVALVVCINQMLNSWNVRLKLFGTNVRAGMTTGFGIRLFNVAHGLVAPTLTGLILGDVLGKTAGLALLMRGHLRARLTTLTTRHSLAELWSTARAYRAYPQQMLPSQWVTAFSSQVPVFLLSAFAGPAVVGAYGFSTSVLDIPLRLLGYSVSTVFVQRASDAARAGPEELRRISTALLEKLVWLVVPFALLIGLGDVLLVLVLGKAWLLSGLVVQSMAAYYALILVATPLSALFNVLRRERALLFINLLSFAVRSGALYIGLTLFQGVRVGLMSFAVASAGMTLLLLVQTLRLASVRLTSQMVSGLGVSAVLVLVLLLLRLTVLAPWVAQVLSPGAS